MIVIHTLYSFYSISKSHFSIFKYNECPRNFKKTKSCLYIPKQSTKQHRTEQISSAQQKKQQYSTEHYITEHNI